MSYTKLFADILTSTVWLEDSDTKVVWVTMLALADQHGEVMGSVPGLAHLAHVPVEVCRAALAKFMSPDPESRTDTEDGRRIEKIDGGWALINYGKYRKLASKEDQKEKTAERNRRYRQRLKRDDERDAARRPVTPRDAAVTQTRDIAEAEAEAEAEADKEYSVAKATERAFALFNDAAKRTGWPQVQKIDARRRKHMQARLKDVGMDGFALAIAKAEASDFLTLKWPLKIDWLLLPANFTKVIEGNYANPPPVESHDDRRDREIREAIERSKLQ